MVQKCGYSRYFRTLHFRALRNVNRHEICIRDSIVWCFVSCAKLASLLAIEKQYIYQSLKICLASATSTKSTSSNISSIDDVRSSRINTLSDPKHHWMRRQK